MVIIVVIVIIMTNVDIVIIVPEEYAGLVSDFVSDDFWDILKNIYVYIYIYIYISFRNPAIISNIV